MKKQHIPLIVLILICLTVGLTIVSDYGESRDEDLNIRYSENTFANYSNLFTSEASNIYGPTDQRFYGPFSDLLIFIGIQFIGFFKSDVSIIHTRHFFDFMFFLLSVVSLYSIARRLFSVKTAYLVALLFLTQPVLWGHAFINSRDIPFMSAFIFSIAVGLYSAEKISPLVNSFQDINYPGTIKTIRTEWQGLQKTKTIIIFFSIFIMSILLFWVTHDQIFSLIESSLIQLDGNRETFWGGLFEKYAANASSIPISSYVSKSILIAKRIFYLYVIGGTAIFLLQIIRFLPKSRARFWRQIFKPLLTGLQAALKNPWIIITGVCIGATTAIRVIGPFAGVLVSVYFLLRFKQKGILPILSIGIIAIVTTYLLWPYLWASPIDHFLKSITVMSDFPWNGKVLFNGEFYAANSLPLYYIPLLLIIQFTEPMVVLFTSGVLFAGWDLLNKKSTWRIWTIIFLWFFVVFLLLLLFNPTHYDNFRHVLFFIPPIFLFSGLAIERLFAKINFKGLQWMIALLIIIPGVYSIVDLHPYQYIYYNNFVGGVEGAFRKFESDYWWTSFTEATEFINQYAKENSRVLVWGSTNIVERIARDDLLIEPNQGGTYDLNTGYDYVILSSRHNMDIENYPDAPVLFRVEKNGAILVVVKQLCQTTDGHCP